MQHAGITADNGKSPVFSIISNKDIHKNHIFQFNGADGLGERRAKKALDSLRPRGGGVWHEIKAKDTEGTRRKVFFNRDQNPKQQANSIAVKRLVRVAQELLPGKQIRKNNKENSVEVGSEWLPFARVVCSSPTSTKLFVNEPVLAQLNLDEETVRQAFLTAGPRSAVWTEACG